MPRRRRGAVSGPRGGSSPDLCDDEDGMCTREKPQQRNAANARERARMRVLSKAFCRLKTTLPWVPADTKLSKLDTLRLATSYIAHLRAILTDEMAEVAPIHPLNLTWPFSFQQQSQGLQGQSPRVGEELRRGADTSPSSSSPDLEEEDGNHHHHHHASEFLNSHHHHHHHHHHQYSDSLLHLG
ncbi:transcription factor 21 [Zootermopsis nevadensis]|uniref:Transcription factor 21 n=1 Tax=Zootermopsis nevadensis TaxID=136037 RepID=A0A067RGH6_ZOONE|nr:transcription factor 21 [Zootermopsis nevadensis]XP_021920077.1 transcription factor 21 [Zootermopsis nevadensis]XP_021920078.1 transcription factor 21 [Zootermopsis nevadensis]KDR19329.1 Transcription factor 21 [Zootermopsis nevadensis]